MTEFASYLSRKLLIYKTAPAITAGAITDGKDAHRKEKVDKEAVIQGLDSLPDPVLKGTKFGDEANEEFVYCESNLECNVMLNLSCSRDCMLIENVLLLIYNNFVMILYIACVTKGSINYIIYEISCIINTSKFITINESIALTLCPLLQPGTFFSANIVK